MKKLPILSALAMLTLGALSAKANPISIYNALDSAGITYVVVAGAPDPLQNPGTSNIGAGYVVFPANRLGYFSRIYISPVGSSTVNYYSFGASQVAVDNNGTQITFSNARVFPDASVVRLSGSNGKKYDFTYVQSFEQFTDGGTTYNSLEIHVR